MRSNMYEDKGVHGAEFVLHVHGYVMKTIWKCKNMLMMQEKKEVQETVIESKIRWPSKMNRWMTLFFYVARQIRATVMWFWLSTMDQQQQRTSVLTNLNPYNQFNSSTETATQSSCESALPLSCEILSV